jgi:hypothetical protein
MILELRTCDLIISKYLIVILRSYDIIIKWYNVISEDHMI